MEYYTTATKKPIYKYRMHFKLRLYLQEKVYMMLPMGFLKMGSI